MVVTKYSLIGRCFRHIRPQRNALMRWECTCILSYVSERDAGAGVRVHSCDVDELIRKLDEHINGPV